jgi:hypothetical protein
MVKTASMDITHIKSKTATKDITDNEEKEHHRHRRRANMNIIDMKGKQPPGNHRYHSRLSKTSEI